MTREKKKKRRYRVTERSGITLKAYRPPEPGKQHKKLPEIVYIYTREEVEALAKKMGFTVSKKLK